MLQILIVGVEGLVVLILAHVVLGHAEKMRGIGLGGVLEREPRQGLVEIAHALGKGHDDLHGDGSVLLDEKAVLIPVHRDEGAVGHCLGGLDVAVIGHRGDDAEKVAGAEDVPAFLLDDLDLFGNPDLAGADDEEAVCALFAFDDDVRVFFEVDKRKLERTIHPVS